ncbi:MAG TPA: nicotinate-nucleotide--dimethylbenzimidazole phosphoribosyltransferase [Natronosporangium sp.]
MLLVVGGRGLPIPAEPGSAAATAPANHQRLAELLAAVAPVDEGAAAAARQRHRQLAKPPGSLGHLEEVGCQLAAIAGRCPPPVPVAPALVVAAADHGVHARGVSDWPQAVTRAMVSTVAAGEASVSAIARATGARVLVLDVGTAGDGPVPAGVRDARVRRATGDLSREPAMTAAECRTAIEAGAAAARELLAAGADLLATGDLGIGNTTATACLIAAYTGAAPASVTGRGANLDDARVPQKVRLIEQALARPRDPDDPLATLASLGGLEHAALVGVILAGAAARVPVVLDGVIAGAAALAAVVICPASAGYLIAGHTSAEPGARIVLDRLGRRALLDLGMRLGEGTGAVLAVPLVQAAARVLAETATIEAVLSRTEAAVGGS